MEEATENLVVYQMSLDLAVRVHAMTLKLPDLERFEEAPQVRRSAKRIVANIVEGHSQRKYKALQLSYLYRALGSSEETEAHLILLNRTGSLADAGFKVLSGPYKVLSGKLFAFIQTVERSTEPPNFVRDFEGPSRKQ